MRMVNSSNPKWSANILCMALTSFTHPLSAFLTAAAAVAAAGVTAAAARERKG
jgi:hypothetical protein